MRKELIVGLVFVAAMVLLGVFTVIVSNFNPFAKKEYLVIRFDNIAGLKRGDEVQVAGAEYGKVTRIKLREGHIYVTVELSHTIKLHEGYKVRVKSASPLGGRMVGIELGDPEKPELPPATTLVGSSVGADIVESINDLVSDVKYGNGTIAQFIREPEIYNNVRDASRSLKAIAQNLEQGQGLVGRLLSPESEPIYADAADAARTFRELAAGLSEGKGTLGRLLKEEDVYQTLKDSADNVKAITTDLRDGKGSIGMLLKDDSAYKNANEAFTSIKEITAELKKGESTAGRLIYDKQMGDDLRDAVAKIKSIATDVSDGKGSLGKLVADTALYDSARKLFDDLAQAADKLTKGEGTLGKLVNDKALYEQAERLASELRQAVEDAREQAPVTSFGSILMGGFR